MHKMNCIILNLASTASRTGTAFDILKRRHQQLDIDIAFRKEILETLASKPKGFASGSRLGCWKRLLYHR